MLALVLWVLGLIIAYYIVRSAVTAAMNDHYKTVRHFEETGEWKPGSWRSKTRPMARR